MKARSSAPEKAGVTGAQEGRRGVSEEAGKATLAR